MGDLLIRDVDDSLKRQLQESAQRNGRSLSDEAIEILRKQMGLRQSSNSAGVKLRALLGDEHLSEDELAAIAASRREPDRDPPRFD